MGRPLKPDNKKKHRMSFTVSKECDELLRRMATAHGVSMTSVMEMAVREFAQNHLPQVGRSVKQEPAEATQEVDQCRA